MGSATLLALVAMFWLQSKFDGADRKAAVGVVREYRARGGWTVPDILDARHPGATPVWSAETQSSCLSAPGARSAPTSTASATSSWSTSTARRFIRATPRPSRW